MRKLETEDATGAGKTPTGIVLEFYAAIRDRQFEVFHTLVDLDVTCSPLVRPGLSTYYGYDGMIRLSQDMHAAHGCYHVTIDNITEEEDSRITVRATIFSEAALQCPPLAVTTVYGFRHGLIYSIESHSGD